MRPQPSYGPVAPEASERQSIRALDYAFRTAPPHGIKLLAVDDSVVSLPDTVMSLLIELTHCLASGQMVTVVPVDRELTTQQVADMLNVSRPHVVKLLDDGAIPFHKTGTHRRIRFDDLAAYRERRDAARRAALDEMTRLGEEMDELGTE